jgi:hypothetical protein
MNTKVFSAVILAALGSSVLLSAPAEARRLHLWWLQDQTEFAPDYNAYDDASYGDQQNIDVQEQFNQDQYDRYMREMHHPKRKRVTNSYYDPQVQQPAYKKAPVYKLKTKVPAKVASSKPVLKKSAVVAAAPALVPARPVQVASISNRFEDKISAKKIDCGKGAAIVAGYGFSSIVSKSCAGKTLVYGATRSGKNFEIQVSSASGELTAVKKL